TYDLFVGKTLLHGDVLMWLMKTLLTSRCINQRGAGQPVFARFFYCCYLMLEELPQLPMLPGRQLKVIFFE
ncbi:hypothetical protein, partial [Enterobacter asburiae]|uniref:hypothetical protein n=1 Tax=Enterobacter asburiae TaxID=61645 RepID=UPI0030176778